MTVDELSNNDAQPIEIGLRAVDSSPDLIQRVGHFMELAERVEANPLFGTSPSIVNFSLHLDPVSNAVTGADISVSDQEPDQWELLLTRERVLVFNEDDPIHITKLAAAIGKEHKTLRPATKVLGRSYRDWAADLVFGVRRLGSITPEELPAVGNVQSLRLGPTALLAPDVDMTQMTTDLELTKL